MAHGLENSNDMMYVGSKPWHGLGVELPRLATANEAITAANLDWAVRKEQVTTRDGYEFKNRFLTVRNDTGRPLGVVSDKYEILQNRDAFNFLDELTMDKNGPKYETAGVLWGGTKVWMLANLGELEVVKNDAVGRYLLISNSHDGSSSIQVKLTPIRVVCQNTLNMALKSGSAEHTVKVRHTQSLESNLKNVKDALGFITHSFEDTFEVYQALAAVTPTKEQVENVLKKLFPDTKREGRAFTQRERVRELSVAGKGNDNPLVRGTAWGLYNGITELSDHYNGSSSRRDDKDDYRVNSSWFGLGATFKANALQLICDEVLR
jgi:phage/plasmid-like protein (TIGR03299 family)